MPELTLQKLPERTPIKLSIVITPQLNDDLSRYAELYASTYGKEEAVIDLIPAMLIAFLESDRTFVKGRAPSSRPDRG
jgi:hypothetical protein